MLSWNPKIELAEYLDEDGNFTKYGKEELERYAENYYGEFIKKRENDYALRDKLIGEINDLLDDKADNFYKRIESIVSSSEFIRFTVRFNSIKDFRTSTAINEIELNAGVRPTIYEIIKCVDDYIELKMMALHCFRRIQMMCPESDISILFAELMERRVSVFFVVQTLREAKQGNKGYVCAQIGELYEKYGMINEAAVMKNLSLRDYSSVESSYLFSESDKKINNYSYKVCFVSCVNNKKMYDECLYYINALKVPEGVEITTAYVTEAESMTSGYNEVMKSEKADIYVFLHQDVSIINPYFLEDILDIFESDKRIGIIGLVGSPKLPPDAVMWHGSRVGNLYSEDSVLNFSDRAKDRFSEIIDVEAVDGLLIATNKGIPFREDIFDGWDFYDASICEEYRKQGYRVVVPNQCVPWVIHDDGLMNLYSYGKYRKIFLEEYYGKK